MMIHCRPPLRYRPSVLVLALCATGCLPAYAEDAADDVRAESGTVSVGAGLISGSDADRALFGQYNGLRSRSATGLLDIDYSLRNDANSTLTQFQAVNLLGETREFNLVWRNPGYWKFSASFGELVRYDPNTVNTGLLGAGTTSPQVRLLTGGPGSGTDLELKTKRTSVGVGLAKWLTPDVQIEFDLKSENKNGSRLFGVGMNCPSTIAIVPAPGCLGSTGINTGWALLMLPEPINANHTQLEARLSYATPQLRMSLGYYGSFYHNSYGSLNPSVPGVLSNPLGNPLPLSTGLQALLSQSVALPPDNQAHHVDLSGSYDFNTTTRATFKLGRALATQHDSFSAAGLSGAPAGRADLGGRVETTLGQLGITARPVPKLTLLGELRYEDKDDETPIALYNTEGTATYTNRALPNEKRRGKLQASWQFSGDLRGTLGADYEGIDRGVFTASSAVAGITALRQKTDEKTVRAELRRRMSEDFSGAISVSSSRRDGSNWLRDNSGPGVTEVTDPADPATGFALNGIFMPTLADRKRDKIKLFADWQPSEALALQASVETGRDRFKAPSAYGLHKAGMNQLSLDGSYALNDSWALTGFASRGVQTMNQSRPAGYVLAFENTNIGAGVGITGRVSSKLELGGSLSHVNDKSVYRQALDRLAGADSAVLLAATGGLPNVVFRQTALKLYGNYKLDEQSSIRVDLIHQYVRTNDWAWGYNGVPFTYSDGSTVQQKQSQSVSFLGVRYVYQFR